MNGEIVDSTIQSNPVAFKWKFLFDFISFRRYACVFVTISQWHASDTLATRITCEYTTRIYITDCPQALKIIRNPFITTPHTYTQNTWSENQLNSMIAIGTLYSCTFCLQINHMSFCRCVQFLPRVLPCLFEYLMKRLH